MAAQPEPVKRKSVAQQVMEDARQHPEDYNIEHGRIEILVQNGVVTDVITSKRRRRVR